VILAGDIGGTKADLALFDPGDGPRRPRVEGRLATRDFESVEALLAEFLANGAAHARPTRAVLGIAGPVHDNRTETTNLPWILDGDEITGRIGAPVTLLNDLAATAWGVSLLGAADLDVLHRGVAQDSNRALIAAGTGLGESMLARTTGGWVVVASEGGHTDFGPCTPLQDELLVWLRARYERVSYERVLSGPGLADLYRFFSDTGRGDEPPAVARRFAEAPDPAVVVTETALDGSCERSRRVMLEFVTIYGAEAGNLALQCVALGGVFLGGGIAPRIRSFLHKPQFLRAFRDKGRLTPVVETIPIAVILDPRTALWGAAAFARAHPERHS
jgi:glucokinase